MKSLTDASNTNQEYEENINVTLKRLRHYNLNNLIFSHQNINSIRNKIGEFDEIVDGSIDILCIAETNLDKSLPNNQFVYQYNQSIYWILQTAKVT